MARRRSKRRSNKRRSRRRRSKRRSKRRSRRRRSRRFGTRRETVETYSKKIGDKTLGFLHILGGPIAPTAYKTEWTEKIGKYKGAVKWFFDFINSSLKYSHYKNIVG